MTQLVVSEVFGPTVQGEGPSAGRRAMFVRLGRCNLDCSWCDTSFTWDWKGKNGVVYDPAVELQRWTVDEILERLDQLETEHVAPGIVVVTGGEPMLQRGLVALCDALDARYDVEIETNGTREPTAALAAYARFNVSPKLRSSGVDQTKAIIPPALESFAALASAGRARFKFVVCNAQDLEQVAQLVRDFGIPDGAVWIMPEGRTAEKVQDTLRRVADLAIRCGWNVSTRLHVELWGDERGR